MDYYKILDLKRDCSDAQVKQQYKKLALKWHPEKNQGQKRELAEQTFREISEAFDVLSDPRLRAKFDQYGDIGLKQGTSNGKGGMSLGWSFNKNPEQMFADFFGSTSPFTENAATAGSSSAASVATSGALSVATPQPTAKPAPLELNLYCSLEELFLGCSKKVKVARKRVSADGKGEVTEDVVVSVSVQPGWRANTKITFPADGHQLPNAQPGDVVLTLVEKPHPVYRRRQDNLYHTATISLSQALCGCIVEVDTLDGRKLSVAVNQIVRPGVTQTVKGEGMPNAKDPKKRGDLIIDFNIVFPASLSEQQKTTIAKVLPP